MRLRRGAARALIAERTKANRQAYGTVEDRARRIEALLWTGPKTPREISVLTEMPIELIGGALLRLKETGRARRVGDEWMLYP